MQTTEVMETVATVATEATEATEAVLNADSIKGLMDAFDPAALLPDLASIFGSLETICRVAVLIGPILMLALGLSYLFFAPKEANFYFGYRCYFGMGSVQAWRFTQRIAGLILGGLGLILTIIMVFITAGFDSGEAMDMVWTAVNCLIWEAVLALAATISINLLAAARYDRRGELRSKSKKKPGKGKAH